MAIRPLLRSKSPALRGEAALALAPQKDPKHYPLLIEMATDRDTEVRHRAILALGVLGQPGTEVILGRILKKAKRGTPDRLLATLALGLLPDDPRVPALDAFFSRAASASRRRIRDELVCLLLGFLRTAHPTRATVLRDMLEDDTYRNRPELALAINALCRAPAPANTEAVAALLKARQHRTLCAALHALTDPSTNCSEAVMKRIRYLATDGGHPAVKAAALDLLTARRDPAALDFASLGISSQAPEWAAAAVRTIRTLGGSVLRKELEDTILVATPTAKQVAMLHANRGPHGDAFIQSCIRMARDPRQPEGVRIESAYAAAEAGWKEIAPTIRVLFLQTRNEAAARRLGEALTKASGAMDADLLPDKLVADIDLLPMRLKALLATGHPDALKLFLTQLTKPSSPAMQLQALRAYRSVRLRFVPEGARDLVPKPIHDILK